MRLLIDLSAWARSGHPDLRRRWEDLLEGDVLTCHPVFALELLHSSIDAADYRRLREDLEVGFDWLWPTSKTAELALALQRRMAVSSPTPQRVRTPDLLTAALAVEHRVGVLHYDSDYDAIRDRGGEGFDSQWIAPRGSLESSRERQASRRRTYSKELGRRMVQLRDDADLEVWPKLIDWIEVELSRRGVELPPPLERDRERPTDD